MLTTLLVLSFLSLSLAQNTLRGAAQGKHFYVGSAANAGHINSGENQYLTTLANQYNLITAENACKWGAIQPQQGRFDFSQCDVVRNFAQKSNQTFRGHNLCWGEYNPNWLTSGRFTPDQKRQLLQTYIETVIKRYGPITWDVVNEAVSDSDNVVLKNNVWYPDVSDYIDVAFKTARAANPQAKLFYNDYNIASSTGWSAQKSQKVYDLVKSMVQRGIPIDGVGLQLHVDLNYGNMLDGVRQNMQRIADLGLEIHITELDVSCNSNGGCGGWGNNQLQQQANVYKGLLQVCMEQKNCTSFETWGFTDKYTWKGTDQHPLPFDQNYQPKPAFNSLLQTLQQGLDYDEE